MEIIVIVLLCSRWLSGVPMMLLYIGAFSHLARCSVAVHRSNSHVPTNPEKKNLAAATHKMFIYGTANVRNFKSSSNRLAVLKSHTNALTCVAQTSRVRADNFEREFTRKL